jgi:hypothetical protein
MVLGIPVLGRIGIVCMMNNAGLIVIPVVVGPVISVRLEGVIMAMNVSIMQCANCGHSIEQRDEIVAFRSIGDIYGSCITRMVGYCCSKCGYMEEV